MLATLRKGLTKREAAGYSPGSLVLHPTDWEDVELALASSNAIEHMSLSYDPATRRLFGVPWWLPGLASITTTRPISCAPTRRDLRRHPQMPCGATLVKCPQGSTFFVLNSGSAATR